MLFSFFLSSAATGLVQGSLSTNREIINNIYEEVNIQVLQVAKYIDLLVYLPCNFLSTYLIDYRGLRFCIRVGAVMMLCGSIIRLSLPYSTIWVWLAGHLICASSQAFLKNPVSKIATNWFGDKEVRIRCFTFDIERHSDCCVHIGWALRHSAYLNPDHAVL